MVVSSIWGSIGIAYICDMRPKKRPLLKNPENTEALLRALSSYGEDSAKDDAQGSNLRKYSKAAKDFMTRYYQSPYYKRMVGGRDMMLSDQGFEDSAEGERLRNVRFSPTDSEEYSGVMKPFKAGDEGVPFQGDLRNPGGAIEMSTYDPVGGVRGIDDQYTYRKKKKRPQKKGS